MTDTLSRRQKRLKAQQVKDAAEVMASDAAKRFICTVLDRCGYYSDPMTGNSQTFYNLGMRRTGMDIMGMLEAADPDAHLKLLQVAAKHRAHNAPQQKGQDDDD